MAAPDTDAEEITDETDGPTTSGACRRGKRKRERWSAVKPFSQCLEPVAPFDSPCLPLPVRPGGSLWLPSGRACRGGAATTGDSPHRPAAPWLAAASRADPAKEPRLPTMGFGRKASLGERTLSPAAAPGTGQPPALPPPHALRFRSQMRLGRLSRPAETDPTTLSRPPLVRSQGFLVGSRSTGTPLGSPPPATTSTTLAPRLNEPQGRGGRREAATLTGRDGGETVLVLA